MSTLIYVCPGGLQINKCPFILFSSHELSAMWEDTISSTEEQLLDIGLELGLELEYCVRATDSVMVRMRMKVVWIERL